MIGAKEVKKIVRYPEGDVFITEDLCELFWERFSNLGSDGIMLDPPKYEKEEK